MREIKFRAWDKKTKKMRAVNSIVFHYEEECFDFDNSRLPKVVNLWGKDIIEDKAIVLHREIKDVELMQYTGLKDKNGKEIYEGDVVKKVDTNGLGWHRERNCKVSFDKEGYWLLTTEYGDGYWIGEVDIEQLEVIGNIFDNPELLNNADKQASKHADNEVMKPAT